MEKAALNIKQLFLCLIPCYRILVNPAEFINGHY